MYKLPSSGDTYAALQNGAMTDMSRNFSWQHEAPGHSKATQSIARQVKGEVISIRGEVKGSQQAAIQPHKPIAAT